ncbi:unnamed protein product [Trichogramma brassicae]|uniref:Reverse transcriptase n=1 Tax=Trichogramma brassicae TaxID=86971 RepID=A0A6H5IGH4_9HYME|nr:unnamed protein product [Trichogramma brassicae]
MAFFRLVWSSSCPRWSAYHSKRRPGLCHQPAKRYNIQIYTRSLIGLSARVCTCVYILHERFKLEWGSRRSRLEPPCLGPGDYATELPAPECGHHYDDRSSTRHPREPPRDGGDCRSDSEDDTPTVIQLKLPECTGGITRIMLDNGATVKIGKVAPDTKVFEGKIIELEGISPEPQPTYGYIFINLWGTPYRFYLIADDFPLREDALIGRNLMRKEAAVISYHYNSMAVRSDPLNPIPFVDMPESTGKQVNVVTRNAVGMPSLEYIAPPGANDYEDYCADRRFAADCDELCQSGNVKPSDTQTVKIPARTRKLVQLKLVATTLRDGYLPRIDTGHPDVFLGENLVRNDGNTCRVYAINSADRDVEFEIRPAEIHPFDYVVQDFESDGSTESEVQPITDLEQRANRIREIVDLRTLNLEEKETILDLIHDYPDLFLVPGDPLPCTNLVYHEIPLENNIPINTKQYRHPPVHKEVVKKDIEKRLQEGIIEPSASPMNSPIWIVPKKPGPDGTPKWRVVIDFRELNKKTVSDAYPLPNIADIMDQLGGAAYFSTFDLASGFHQIPMKEGDKWKTAFSTPNGHFQYCRMPMGLKNAPATFQRLMDKVLRGKPFTLTTDSSDLAIGAVLSQERDGFDHPIGYLSRVLNKAEVNYSTTEKECLAALYAMYHYRPYLLGQPFTLVADHEPLNWMHNRKDPGQRLMRWMFKFTDYQYTFKYRPGKENVVADFLSRNPIVETPEAEINQRLPLLRVLMYSRKKAVPPKGNPRPRSDSPAPNTNPGTIQQPRKVTTRASRSKPAETTPAPDPEASCIALRTRSRLPSTKTPALPTPPVAARVDTGLRRSKGKTPTTSKAQQSAPPSEPSTSMAAQCSTTDLENSESENPPLVDPRYSGLREETEPPTEGTIPIPNLKASTIADALARHLICQFGAPRAILSDRGTSFLSDLVESVLRIFKVKHLTTSSYRPQTNGSLERSHGPLVDFIRTYSENYDDWDRLTPFATFTYNTSVHSATNFTPFELVYGRVARFPLRIPSEDKLPTYNLYLQDLLTRLGEMKTLAAERQIMQKHKAKTRHDRHLKPFKGRVGGYAWILNEPRIGKFDKFYKAPLLIKEVLGNSNVILELPTGQQIRKHTSKLKAVPD